MTQRMTLLTGLAVIALAALVVFLVNRDAEAQGSPPPLPGLFLGEVEEGDGPVAGDPIIAFVRSDDGWANCGFNYLKEDDEGQLVYDIDVNAREPLQSPGCGMEGSTVRFYFPDTRQYAEQEGDWTSVVNDIVQLDLTVGSPLGTVNYVPNASSDKLAD